MADTGDESVPVSKTEQADGTAMLTVRCHSVIRLCCDVHCQWVDFDSDSMDVVCRFCASVYDISSGLLCHSDSDSDGEPSLPVVVVVVVV